VTWLAPSNPNLAQLHIDIRIGRVDQRADDHILADKLMDQIEACGGELGRDPTHPRNVAAGSIEARHQPTGDRISAADEDNGNFRRCGFRSQCWRDSAERLESQPITGIPAFAGQGHTAAAPNSVMNSRLFIRLSACLSRWRSHHAPRRLLHCDWEF
jgi:hypothetical protein